MLIKKVNENKLEIFIGIKDLEANKISIYDFMSSYKKRNRFLLHIINFAGHKKGISYKKSKTVLECYCIPSIMTLIITITKVSYNVHRTKYKKLKMHNFFLASFENLETLFAFCNTINKKLVSSLYFYQNSYFLSINVTSFYEFKEILYSLKEFSQKYKKNNFIDENANLIIKNNAIEICKNLFVK